MRKLAVSILSAVAVVGIVGGMTLGVSSVTAEEKKAESFFSATENAEIIADYQAPEHLGDYKGLFVKAVEGGTSTVTLNHEIDLRMFSKEDSILEILPVTTKPLAEKKDLQINRIYFRFTDVEDKDAYVEVCLAANPDPAFPYTSYASACGDGQVLTGWNFQQAAVSYKSGGNYGRCVTGNLYGRARADVAVEHDIKPFSVRYDYESSQVHASVIEEWKSTLVADLTDTTHMQGIWDGLPSGKVKLSITAESNAMSNKDAGFMILNFCGIDFSKTEWTDTEAPVIQIDSQGYGLDDLPQAEIFNPYPVYEGIAFDIFDCAYGEAPAEKDLSVSVFTLDATGEKEVEVVDGYFIPKSVGTHYIRYYAEDFSGNEAEILLEIEVEPVTEIVHSFELPLEGVYTVGVAVAVPNSLVEGVKGEYEVKTEIFHTATGENMPISFGTFIPKWDGAYTVKVTVKDFLNREATFYYYTSARASATPILENAPSLPSVLYIGKEVSFPDFKAYDYYSLKGNKSEADKYYVIYDAQGTEIKRVKPEEVFIPDSSFGESVSVQYVAKSILYEQKIEGEARKMNVIDLKDPIDVKRYFTYNQNVEKVEGNYTGERNVSFFVKNSEAEIYYGNPSFYKGADIYFRVPKEANGYESITVTFTDGTDASKQVQCTIVRDYVTMPPVPQKPEPLPGMENDPTLQADYDKALNDYKIAKAAYDQALSKYNSSKFFVNGVEKGRIQGNFLDTVNDNFRIYINSVGEITDARANKICTVDTYLSGEPFEGFTDNLCYISFSLGGVDESGNILSVLQIVKIGSQALNAENAVDSIKPTIQLADTFSYEQTVGTVTLPGAIALDVLCGQTDVFVEVTINGGREVLFSGKVTKKAIQFKLGKSGQYRVRYYSEDASGKTDNKEYVLNVYDQTPFRVQLAGDIVAEAKQNAVISLPSFQVEGRTGDYVAVVYVVCPKGGLIDVTDTMSFEATQKGTYKIYYYVVFESEHSYVYDLSEFAVTVK